MDFILEEFVGHVIMEFLFATRKERIVVYSRLSIIRA
jgi:hypothetical protein